MVSLFNFFVMDDTMCEINLYLTIINITYAVLFNINHNYFYRFVLKTMFFRLIVQRLVYASHGLSEKKYIVFPLVFLSLLGIDYDLIKIPFGDTFLIFSYVVIWIDSIIHSLLKHYNDISSDNNYYEQLDNYSRSIGRTNFYTLVCVLIMCLHYKLLFEKK